MSLPKKGSSILVIDEEQYRWAVSPDSGYMLLVIEEAAGKGRRLEVLKDYETPITPKVVREAILQARKLGWDPKLRGKPVLLAHNESGQLELFDRKAKPRSTPAGGIAVGKKQKRPQVSTTGGYPCPTCEKSSLHHVADGYFACGSCGRTFMPDELRKRLQRP